jgi:transposase
MKQYPKELKDRIIARMLAPHNESVPALAHETGIPKDTLYGWRLEHRGKPAASEQTSAPAGRFSGAEKLAIVIETAPLTEHELGEYCRTKGLYPQQVGAWRSAFEQSAEPAPSRAATGHNRELAREIRQLRSELQRKDQALAEAAALLVLSKKARALWGEHEDAVSPTRSAAK